jgi:DNA-binding MarR family transcriptional regulator
MSKVRKRQPLIEEIKELAEQIADTDFWSCVRFADIIDRYVEITMKRDNVSRLHGVAMTCLVLSGGNSTPTQLAGMMFRSKHSITQIVDYLEKEDLVVRDNTGQDRRVTHIKVTSAGLEYVRQNFSKGNKRAKEVTACLNNAEQKLLVNLIGKMSQRITKVINGL